MRRYAVEFIVEAKKLRMRGKTYSEINSILKTQTPKSTLREWFRNVPLPKNYRDKITQLNKDHLNKVRIKAVETNKIRRRMFINSLDIINRPISKKIMDKDTSKIALAMLCLGEASKSGSGSAFSLGSANSKIITLFLVLLKRCFEIDRRKFRCTVQCRADQNTENLEKYWQKLTGIPLDQFYKPRIDSRTIGKPTLKKDYKGVLKVDYFDSKIQLELESLANLVYNTVADQG